MDIFPNKISKNLEPVRDSRGHYPKPPDIELPRDSLVYSASDSGNISIADMTRIAIFNADEIHEKSGSEIDSSISDSKYGAAMAEKIQSQGNSLLQEAAVDVSGRTISAPFKADPLMDPSNVATYRLMESENLKFNFIASEGNPRIISNAETPVNSEWNVTAAKPFAVKDLLGEKAGILYLSAVNTSDLLQEADREKLLQLNAEKTAEKFIPKMKNLGAKLIAVISPLDAGQNIKLASRLPDINLIIGGGSGDEGERVYKSGGTYIYQGSYLMDEPGPFIMAVVPCRDEDGITELAGVKALWLEVPGKNAEIDHGIYGVVNKYSARMEKNSFRLEDFSPGRVNGPMYPKFKTQLKHFQKNI